MGIVVAGHGISIETQPSGNYTVYVAVCECGRYRSKTQVTSVEAVRSGNLHLISMRRLAK